MLDLETFKLRAKGIYPKAGLERKLIVLRQYESFLEKSGLQPGLESLNFWLDELLKRRLSSSTIGVYLYDVLTYFELMMFDLDEKKLKLLKKRLPPRIIGEVEFLTEEEVAGLITKTLSPIHRLIYALAYTYGRRLGEVLTLKRSDVNFEKNTVTFTVLKKKREEKATYDLEPWIKDMLLKYSSVLGRRRLFELTERAVEIGFKKDCERAGIKPQGRRLRPHLLRHARVTHLRTRGIPLDLISKRIVRHSRLDTTFQFYRGVSEEEITSIPKAEEILRK